jgi:hypothetical protein
MQPSVLLLAVIVVGEPCAAVNVIELNVPPLNVNVFPVVPTTIVPTVPETDTGVAPPWIDSVVTLPVTVTVDDDVTHSRFTVPATEITEP